MPKDKAAAAASMSASLPCPYVFVCFLERLDCVLFAALRLTRFRVVCAAIEVKRDYTINLHKRLHRM
jgi:hypothetical protein